MGLRPLGHRRGLPPKTTSACWRALRDRFEIVPPGGAFYLFPKAPWGTGSEFVAEAIRHDLLMLPGCNFSRRDTNFRVSYAADDAVLDRGIDILNRLGAPLKFVPIRHFRSSCHQSALRNLG